MNAFRSLLLLLIILIPSLSIAGSEWQLLRVNGSSMEPAIRHGDKVCLHRGVSEFSVGDLVAIRLDQHKPPLLKRVVAVAGDRVEFNGRRLIRNGSTVANLPAGNGRLSALKLQLPRYGNTVPAGNLVALGDNREKSFDSLEFGLITCSQIIGKIDTNTAHCTE